MSKVIREAVVRVLTEEQIENRQAEFVISSETPDTYGTVFKIDGWELERYALNPVVLYAHKSYSDDPDMVIGTSVVRVENGELIATVTFENAEDNPLAEKVFRKVQNGTLRMASIGADIHDWHWGDFDEGENPDLLYFDRQSLLEWSIVPIGSNPDALKRSAEYKSDFEQRFPKAKGDVRNKYAVRAALVDLKIKMLK